MSEVTQGYIALNPVALARRQLWQIGSGYLLFVIYGSLVPLHFQALPLDAAITAFSQIPWLKLGIGSRADWVANLLLFIPLTFILTGAISGGRGPLIRLAASLLALMLGIGLSFGIEFTQLYFPQRTVSQNDIAAESLGAFLGVVFWWSFGARFQDWHTSWLKIADAASMSDRVAWVYLAVVLAYNVLPLDLTISVVEIFHKWREGKLVLIPFSGLPSDPAYAVYEIATDALVWVPLTFLWRYRGARSTSRVWVMGGASAFLVEFLQLFVYSRVSDVTDIFTGILGAWLGAQLGAWMGKFKGGVHPGRHSPRVSGFLPLAFSIGWFMVLIVLFWYPFNFRTDGAYIRERMVFLGHVPFEVYYFGTEFRAITEVFHKILFFAPLGGFLAWWVRVLSWRWREWAGLASFLGICSAALTVELGQVMLPQRIPDTTDATLECLGGVLGYLLVRLVWERMKRPSRPIRDMSNLSGQGSRPHV